MKMIHLLLAFCATGCATINVVDTSTRSTIREELEEGDRITLTTIRNQIYVLTVINLTDEAIEAQDEDERSVTIPYEEVARVAVRQRRPGRTAAAVVGGVIGATVVVYVAAIVAVVMVLGGA